MSSTTTSNSKAQSTSRRHRGFVGIAIVLLVSLCAAMGDAQTQDLPQLITQVQPRMVKIFGAGGLNRLEHYQSGCFIGEDGLILTVWSYVLDTESITVFANDGTRLESKLVGFDTQTGIALLKAETGSFDYFEIEAKSQVGIGLPVLAFSNLYGVATGNEQVSVQQGVVTAITELSSILDTQAGRGSAMSYSGPALIVDAITSNPGSAGGVITNHHGEFLGLIGKELRSSSSGLWVNYAIPSETVDRSVAAILAGEAKWAEDTTTLPSEPMTLELLGIVLLPNVVARTPPFVDRIVPGGPAERSELKEDDLIVEVSGFSVSSRADVIAVLNRVDRDDRVSIVVQRGQELLNFELTTHE